MNNIESTLFVSPTFDAFVRVALMEAVQELHPSLSQPAHTRKVNRMFRELSFDDAVAIGLQAVAASRN